jgi:hypothetical protein
MLKTIFGEKDKVVVRKDVEEVGIRLELWLQQLLNGSFKKPVAPYTLTKEEKRLFLEIIKFLRTPTLCCKVAK